MIKYKTVWAVYESSGTQDGPCAIFRVKSDAEYYQMTHFKRHGFVKEMGYSEAIMALILLMVISPNE